MVDQDALVHVSRELLLAHVALDALLGPGLPDSQLWGRPGSTHVHPATPANTHPDVETLGHQIQSQLLFLLLCHVDLGAYVLNFSLDQFSVLEQISSQTFWYDGRFTVLRAKMELICIYTSSIFSYLVITSHTTECLFSGRSVLILFVVWLKRGVGGLGLQRL